MKCFFDYLVVITLCPFWLPLIIFLAILIKMLEPQFPIFFIQKRIGRNGNSFKMIKFRSMVPNTSSYTITSQKDLRITKLGRTLRKWKLDELPELFNILAGDMSLVGPRPDVPGYADKLQGNDRLILKLKPGITGPASLKYSNEEELLAQVEDPIYYNNNFIYPDKVKINLHYYYHYNIWMDINLLFRTLFTHNKSVQNE
jgi:lipopolysaccharide/colanic/teichoic acid biosynthesis glycosyltransferase